MDGSSKTWGTVGEKGRGVKETRRKARMQDTGCKMQDEWQHAAGARLRHQTSGAKKLEGAAVVSVVAAVLPLLHEVVEETAIFVTERPDKGFAWALDDQSLGLDLKESLAPVPSQVETSASFAPKNHAKDNALPFDHEGLIIERV
jgi:hypothetical protein